MSWATNFLMITCFLISTICLAFGASTRSGPSQEDRRMNQFARELQRIRKKVSAQADEMKEIRKLVTEQARVGGMKYNEIDFKCDFKYYSKCFKVIIYPTYNVTFDDAETICNEINGKPANIYDADHYLDLLDYALPKIQDLDTTLWTGMKYKNDQLQLDSGKNSSLPQDVWWSGFPIEDVADRINVAVGVTPDRSNLRFLNVPPYHSYYGVICEKINQLE